MESKKMMGRGVRERDGALVVMPGFRILPSGDIGIKSGELVEFAAALLGVSVPRITSEIKRDLIEMAREMRVDVQGIPTGCRVIVDGEEEING